MYKNPFLAYMTISSDRIVNKPDMTSTYSPQHTRKPNVMRRTTIVTKIYRFSYARIFLSTHRNELLLRNQMFLFLRALDQFYP